MRMKNSDHKAKINRVKFKKTEHKPNNFKERANSSKGSSNKWVDKATYRKNK